MSPLPQELVDRWQYRRENSPGQGTVYWHILLGDNTELRSIAEKARARLAKFPDLHQTPLRWLHVTTLIAGSAEEIGDSGLSRMLTEARTLLSDTAPIDISLSRVLYHPEAIVLDVHPQEALGPIRQAAHAATRAVMGRDARVSDSIELWKPHVTLCYSTGRQPAGPVIAALGKELPTCEVSVRSLSLVVQRGPERLWNWHHIGSAHLGGSSA